MKKVPLRPATWLLVLLATGGLSLPAAYNPFLIEPRGTGPRAGQGEVYGLGQFAGLDNITRNNLALYHPVDGWLQRDVDFDFDSFWSGGMGMAYNFNNYFAVRGEFTFGSVDYDARFEGGGFSGEMLQSGGTFNLDYNILAKPVTPFVSAGLGYQYFDSDIISGPPEYYYWGDPYWGWGYSVYYPTYSDTFFTLNAQGGVRWDVNEHFFIKLWGGAGWMYVGDGNGWPALVQGSFALGAKF